MRVISLRYRFAAIFLLTLMFEGVSSGQKSKTAKINRNNKTYAHQKQDTALEQQKKSGLESIKQQNWQNAALIFEQVLSKSPKEQSSKYWLALAYFNLKRIDEADAQLNELSAQISFDSNRQLFADSMVLSAVISAVRKDNLAAIEKLKTVVKKVPGHFDANISLGRAYFGEKNLDKAIEFFKKAKVLRSSDLNTRFYLATALENSGNYRDALAEYRGILSLDPPNPMGNLGLGILILKSNGDTEEAISALQNALKVNGNLYEAHVEIGKALIKIGRPEESLEHLKKATELKPDNPEPHFQLSIAYRKLGRKAEADEEAAIVKKIHESRRGTADPQ